jgi:hypothetical protein
VVGSNGPEFLGRLPRLKFAESDAARFIDAITEPHVGFLRATQSPRDPRSIIEQFSEIAAGLTEKDDLLFYFSGHGLVSYGDFYLVLDHTSSTTLMGQRFLM